MKEVYETKITDARWIFYDIPGNIGWISYIVCLILAFVNKSGSAALNFVAVIPAGFILLGIVELISERIAGLDRVLSKSRLFRGFGALTLGGGLGAVVALIAVILHFSAVYLIMFIGSLLCGVFCGLLFAGYKKRE